MKPNKPTNSKPTDDLPLLTQVVGNLAPQELPVLTEIVTEPAAQLHPALVAKEQQKILRLVEKHLETRLAQKVSVQFDQLHRQAIAQAVIELKTELPELLRDALRTHFDTPLPK